MHAYTAFEIRIVVIAGWCRFNTSNLWRIIQQNKWENKAEWGILSNRSQVGLGMLIVCCLSNLFQLQPSCLTLSLRKVCVFQITFHAWPQSYNWFFFLLAVVVKMHNNSNFNPTAVHFALCKWLWNAFATEQHVPCFYPLFQADIRRSWSRWCLLPFFLLLAFLAFFPFGTNTL